VVDLRKTYFYDIPVKKSTRRKLKKAKGEKTYDEFLNYILNTELGF
jgi:hypothetical protein